MMTETVVTVDPNRPPGAQTQPKPSGLGWVQINFSYFTTIPGIIKIVQIVSFYRIYFSYYEDLVKHFVQSESESDLNLKI